MAIIVAIFAGRVALRARGDAHVTPQQLETISFESSVTTIRNKLGVGGRSTDSVRVDFAGSKWARVFLESDDNSHITSMTLIPESDEKDAVPNAIEVFARRFRTTDDFVWEWGNVKFDLRNNEIAFHVRRKRNPIAARQADAARQVLLEAAFGFPVLASAKELADVLGAGYPLTDIGDIGPVTPLERARASIFAHCPGALERHPNEWSIPVDHPMILGVTLSWGDERLHVSFTPSHAYDEKRLANCIQAKGFAASDDAFEIGSARVALHPDAIELDTHSVDAASFARTFDTLAACP